MDDSKERPGTVIRQFGSVSVSSGLCTSEEEAFSDDDGVVMTTHPIFSCSRRMASIAP
jgi:hypothetical protein